MPSHKNTATSFQDKWFNNPRLAFNETLREGSEIFNWVLNRNGFAKSGDLKSFLARKERILDAGCGNGRMTALLRKYSKPNKTEIVGIDLVSASIAAKNLEKAPNVSFFKKDLMKNLSDLGTFDFIYAQEVLHHTKKPEVAFRNLVKLLTIGGEIAIYVYKKKAPIREYTDDYIRRIISPLPYRKAMEVCRQIALLSKTLTSLNMKFKSPAIDALEIPKGEYDIQRFIYHFFMKCYWNPKLSFEENAVINYDWYHPQDCSRHTAGEVRKWFSNAGLKINHEFSDFYGITMKGKRV